LFDKRLEEMTVEFVAFRSDDRQASTGREHDQR